MNNKVSVLMSTFNSERTVAAAIESLINQTYKNIEILISDDCSEDKTFDICSEYERNNENIYLFKNKTNIGLTKSLNLLLKKSSGTYIARQDSDDISFNKRIQTQLKFLTDNKLDACTSRALIMNSNKKIPGISSFFPTNFLIKYKNPFLHGTLLIKKESINDIGGYDENFLFSQDYKLMTDLIKNGNKIKIQNKVLYYLNMEDNISTNFKNEQKYYSDCVRKNIIPKAVR